MTRHIHGSYIRDDNTKHAAHALSIFCLNNLQFAIKINALIDNKCAPISELASNLMPMGISGAL